MIRKFGALLGGTFIFAGIPVIIWGCSDFHGFLAVPERAWYVGATVVAQILAACFVPGQGFSAAEGKLVVARQRIAVVCLQVLTLGTVIVAPLSDRLGWLSLPGSLRIAGLALYALGAFLMNWSIIWLGRHFSVQVTIQSDHLLITEGPYRYVRHPRYTGIFLCFLGMALVFASGLGLLLAALLLLTLLWRVFDEEKLMAATFPTQWRDYVRTTTARLIPYVF